MTLKRKADLFAFVCLNEVWLRPHNFTG